MALFFIFMLGVANFALQRAVLESGHPLLGHLPWFYHVMGGSRFSMGVEFVVLLAAMLLSADGQPAWAWAYGAYSLINAVSAWLILSNRV